jgi:hypothetical protein
MKRKLKIQKSHFHFRNLTFFVKFESRICGFKLFKKFIHFILIHQTRMDEWDGLWRKVNTADFEYIKVDDVVQRRFGADGPAMDLKVTKIQDGLIVCGPWKFSQLTGQEVDEDLGWHAFASGSSIVPRQKPIE